MLTIPGTLNSTQVRLHTQIDLLTRRVWFVTTVKHMMISTQVRRDTHLDLSTCRVCAVKHVDWRDFLHHGLVGGEESRGTLPSIYCPHDTPLSLFTVLMTLVRSSAGCAAAAGLKPLRMPRAPDDKASVLSSTLVRSLPTACAWSRSLSFSSVLVCDLLPRQLFHGFAKGALLEEYLSHNFVEHCLGGH